MGCAIIMERKSVYLVANMAFDMPALRRNLWTFRYNYVTVLNGPKNLYITVGINKRASLEFISIFNISIVK